MSENAGDASDVIAPELRASVSERGEEWTGELESTLAIKQE
jgi:hypothetical protein